MNYGHEGTMTDIDRADLKRLYQSVWNGELTEIDGAPIRLMYPYSSQAGNHPTGQFADGTSKGSYCEPVEINIGGRTITVQ